ncbi:hypothetical protein TgHK011_003639 [Trichoderma gracile]|nr:hypothetical protein TgHK011_003639 [Trichoderma gracile]
MEPGTSRFASGRSLLSACIALHLAPSSAWNGLTLASAIAPQEALRALRQPQFLRTVTWPLQAQVPVDALPVLSHGTKAPDLALEHKHRISHTHTEHLDSVRFEHVARLAKPPG